MKKSEFADALRSGVGQITDLAKKYTKSGDVHLFTESLRQKNERSYDMGAYGFESFQVGDDIEVFVKDTPTEKVFMDSEVKVESVTPAVDVDEVPAEQPKIEDFSMDAEDIPEAEQIQIAEPVTEQPKIEEFMEQPVIIRPEIIEDVKVPVEAEEVDMYVGEAPVVAAEFEPSSLFGNIRRGMSEEVDTRVGCVEDGFIKESASNVSLYDFDMPEQPVDIAAEEAAIDDMEIASQSIPAPAEERLMLRPYEQKAMPSEPVIYVERATPKLEDFITEAPKISEAPVVTSIPEWDVADDVAYSEYLSMIPEESAWDVAPVWEVSDSAAEAFSAYQTIRPEYPKAVAVQPEWDVKADTFADYLSFIPEEETWDVAPVWDVTEEAADSYVAFGTIRPEYPKTVAVQPEWDVTDVAVEGFEGYRMAEDDYFSQSAMFVAATVSVSRIEIDPIERNVSDAAAAVSGITGTYAETTGEAELLIPVKDNADFNQESLQIVPEIPAEKKVRTSRFVFKDGRLQKITEEVDLVVDTPVTVDSSTVSEEQPAEPSVIALPAAQSFVALPQPAEAVVKGTEVRFSFGQSEKGYGSVRFSF